MAVKCVFWAQRTSNFFLGGNRVKRAVAYLVRILLGTRIKSGGSVGAGTGSVRGV